MDKIVFSRKYRPKKISDVIGQDFAFKTIENAFESKKVAHAFVFTGIRGVGKTTIARIVAKALNCSNGFENKCKLIELDDDIASRWGPRVMDFLEAIATAVEQMTASETVG